MRLISDKQNEPLAVGSGIVTHVEKYMNTGYGGVGITLTHWNDDETVDHYRLSMRYVDYMLMHEEVSINVWRSIFAAYFVPAYRETPSNLLRL